MNIFESDNILAGTRATETAHRKIELQSPADLTYLIANVSRAAREKIDKHLPPDAAPEGQEDEMRKRVETLVDEYIRNVFSGAKSSLSVNGMEVGEMEEVMGRVREGEGKLNCAYVAIASHDLTVSTRNRALRRKTRPACPSPLSTNRKSHSPASEPQTKRPCQDSREVHPTIRTAERRARCTVSAAAGSQLSCRQSSEAGVWRGRTTGRGPSYMDERHRRAG
jgi:hypothetical protein